MSDEHTNLATTSINIAVLRGVIVGEPSQRTLPSGAVAVGMDLATTLSDGRVTVPLAWINPSPRVLSKVAAGREVMVVGSVRRRFFRAGGVTQSRTEVIIDQLLLATSRRSVDRLVGSVVTQIKRSS